ncbi:MAG: hypothetical protein AAFZ87_14975 [Planctomycetota bacterium]
MSDSPKKAPPSLDPKSAGCWIPALIGATLIVLSYVGVQRLMASTGPWAIESARNAVATSGLHPEDRAAVLAQIQRLETALEGEVIDAQKVTEGVSAILQDPLIVQLTLDDVAVRRIPASGLGDAEKGGARDTLERLASLFESNLVEYAAVTDVLGPLVAEEKLEPDARVELDDDALRALVDRAARAIETVDAETLAEATLTEIDRAALLKRLEASIGATTAAAEE